MRLDRDAKVNIESGHQRPTFLVAIPTLGTVPIEFVVGFSRMQMPVNTLCESFIMKGMEVGQARDFAAHQLLNKGPARAKYLLFVGDDMLLNWNSLLMLHEEMEEGNWDVLAGLYYMKGEPPVPVMHRKDTPGRLIAGKHFTLGEAVWADIVGMDFTLIRAEVFDKLGDGPWFRTGPTGPSNGDAHGIKVFTEDVWFCDLCREKGLKIGVHTGVRVGHYYAATGEVF